MLNIDELIKDSLKNKKTTELKVFRILKSDIMAFKTQKNAPVYDEAAELKLIQKYVAKMEDAEKQYLEAGREDLAIECREELEVLKKLLPEPVSTDEIHKFVYDYCVTNDFHNNDTIILPKKFMGITIKAAKEAFPTADGKMISEIVKTYVE
jgi:uncharacterized protein YqeY